MPDTNLCVFTTGNNVDLLSESCMRVGITLQTYEAPWTDYVEVKLKRGISFLKQSTCGFSMWVDGHDTLVLQPAEEIINRLLHFDHRMAIAAEHTCWPDADLSSLYPPAPPPRFLNAGGFVGPRNLVIEAMQAALDAALSGDDQRAWTLAYLRGALPFAGIDHQRRLFSSVADGDVSLEADTCVMHWNGKLPGREEYWRKLCLSVPTATSITT